MNASALSTEIILDDEIMNSPSQVWFDYVLTSFIVRSHTMNLQCILYRIVSLHFDTKKIGGKKRTIYVHLLKYICKCNQILFVT